MDIIKTNITKIHLKSSLTNKWTENFVFPVLICDIHITHLEQTTYKCLFKLANSKEKKMPYKPKKKKEKKYIMQDIDSLQ